MKGVLTVLGIFFICAGLVKGIAALIAWRRSRRG